MDLFPRLPKLPITPPTVTSVSSSASSTLTCPPKPDFFMLNRALPELPITPPNTNLLLFLSVYVLIFTYDSIDITLALTALVSLFVLTLTFPIKPPMLTSVSLEALMTVTLSCERITWSLFSCSLTVTEP